MKDRSEKAPLRKRAEKKVSEKNEAAEQAPSADMGKLIHELQVHQVELEMQNDELRKAQQVIEESRSRYADLYDFAPVGYFTLDRKGVIVEANLTGADLLGFERNLLLKTPFSLYIMPEHTGLFFEYRRKIFQIPGRQTCELRLKRKVGIPLWLRLDGAVVVGPGGKLTRMRVTASDITERKRAEEEILLSLERLCLALDASNSGAWECDLRSNEIVWSEDLWKIYELKPHRCKPSREAWWQTLLADDRAKAERAVQKAARKGTELNAEWRSRGLDGTERWLMSRGRPIQDEDGQMVRFIGIVTDITERKRMEEVLRASEEQHRTIFRTAQDGIWRVDSQGFFLEVNEAYCRMSGYSKQELLAMRILDVEAAKTEDNIAALIQEIMGQRKRRFESRHRRKDGSIFDVEISVQYWFSDGEQFVAFLRDITERKQVEEALRKSEESSRRLAEENAVVAEIGRIINSTPNIDETYKLFAEKAKTLLPYDRIAINLVDRNGGTLFNRYVEGDSAPERNAGEAYPRAGTLTERIIQSRKGFLFNCQDKNGIAPKFPGLVPEMKAGFRSFLSIPLISRDQTIGGLHFRSKRSRAYEEKDLKVAERIANQIAGAIANAQLFEQGKGMEAELRKSEERYRNLVELVPLMIMIHQEEKYVYANPAAVKALGASSADELLGKSIFEVIHPEYWEMVKARLSLLGKGEGIPLVEEKFIRLDKKIIDVEVTLAQTLYYDKPVILFVGHDITDKKRMEEEKATLQAQFYQAQKIEAIGQLAGGFAHDFNNSLTLISVCSQLILMNLAQNDPLREKIETIYSAIGRSASLARQLLAFSRRQIMEMRVINLNIMLKETDKMIRRVIGENIKLELDLDQNLGATKVDPSQMEQVVINLLINARDSMPNGGNLTVRTENIDLGETIRRLHPEIIPGRYVSMSVEDTGVGILPEIQTRIFEPFFTTKEEGKGTGLGLSSAYGIIKQSEGYIYVESEPGKGTTFRVYIPRVEEPVIEEEKEVSGKELPRGGEAILVVEDEKDLREFIMEILRRQGYKIWGASNGGEAFLFCEKRKEPIDLMITDVIMPGMSGKELADRLQPLQPEMKILYISGYSNGVIAPHGVLRAGVNFIQKPFTVEDLAGRVRKALGKEKIQGLVQRDPQT